MVSTPHGLFVGTANPFGPEVGVKRDGEWRYEWNPRGGAEVWLGSRGAGDAAARRAPDRRSDRHAARYRRAIFRLGREVDHCLTAVLLDKEYADSGFHHVGCWDDSTASLQGACERLVAELASRASDRGRILDVICGRGGTTNALAARFGTGRVRGVDSSYWAIDWGRARFPRLDLRGADPAHLEDVDEAYGTVFCFEGALKIETRYLFLKEALRVLEPGGRLVMADMLPSSAAVRAHPRLYRPNYVSDLDAYRRLFARAGFAAGVEIEDRTEESLWRHAEHLSASLRDRYRRREMVEGQFTAAMAALSHRLLTVGSYLLVSARKPA
jgi:ubiquinone/menaquinone biosynthesis C-methylase UbiE